MRRCDCVEDDDEDGYTHIYIYIYIRITYLDDHMFLQMGVFGFEISFSLLVIPSHIANEM